MAGHSRGRDRPVIGADERLALNRMGSFDGDLESGTFELDDAGLAVFDPRPGAYDGMASSLISRVPPDEGLRLDAVVNAEIRGGRSSYGSYFRLTRRTGMRQWTHVRGRILRDDRRRPYRIVRNATAEPAQFAGAGPAETGRPGPTTVVQTTIEALSRAVTVDDAPERHAASGHDAPDHHAASGHDAPDHHAASGEDAQARYDRTALKIRPGDP
ncbi:MULTISPECIES: PAS domain-containing protein [unclassified Streptomyces]|uniref:PAS domain-containing protein n=1 Tax=unclassified Streptomyces TaxID=2593676 RepID=UPI0037F28410